MEQKEIWGKKFLSHLGLSALLNIGFVLILIIAGFICIFSMNSLREVTLNLELTAKQTVNITSNLKKVQKDSEKAVLYTDELKEGMNKRLIKTMRTNASDMKGLQKIFEDIVSTLKSLIESGEDDPAILLLEVEEIYEKVRKESLPLVRDIAENILASTEEGKKMAVTINILHENLLSFVNLAKKTSTVSDKIKDEANKFAKKAKKTRNIMLTVLILSIGVIIIVAFCIKIAITRPIKNMISTIEDIAREWDLTRRVTVESKDQIGDLAKWFNTFIKKLHTIISKVSMVTDQIASSATETSATAGQAVRGAQKQNEETSQVAASIEEMVISIAQVAENSALASMSTKKTMEIASKGAEVVATAVEGIVKVEKSAKASAIIISSLGGNSKQIGEIISVIDDIADQTNLLALNAAIEAARAGEQGRGFAVVADEVRKLAERTTKATKEIASMIKTIQSDTTNAVSSMEEGTKQVSIGVNLITRAGKALQEITEMITNVNNEVTQIATTTEQQAITSEEIVNNNDIVLQVAKELASGAEESSDAAKNLSKLSEELKYLVGQFRV